MPLKRDASDKTRTENALEMIAAGHARDQSWAAAYRMQREMRGKRHAEGGQARAPVPRKERPKW